LHAALTLGFYSFDDDLATELQKIGFKLAATRAEAAYRLARYLMLHGRGLLRDQAHLRTEARRALLESISCWSLQNWSILDWERNLVKKRTALGMRGVAHLLIARGMRNERLYTVHLTAAQRDLETSIAIGNVSAESLEYAAEIRVRQAFETT